MSYFPFCLGGREADGRASDAGTWRQRWRSVADEGDGSDAEEDACHAALPGPPPTARKGRDTIHAQQVECLCTYTPTDRHTHTPETCNRLNVCSCIRQQTDRERERWREYTPARTRTQQHMKRVRRDADTGIESRC